MCNKNIGTEVLLLLDNINCTQFFDYRFIKPIFIGLPTLKNREYYFISLIKE